MQHRARRSGSASEWSEARCTLHYVGPPFAAINADSAVIVRNSCYGCCATELDLMPGAVRVRNKIRGAITTTIAFTLQTAAMTSANAADVLFVVDPYDDVVLRYDVGSGAYLGKMAAITEFNGPSSETVDIVRGPDGLLYVGNSGRNPGGGNDKNGVLRFDPVNSTLIDSFVSSGSGGLFNSSGPRMAFGPDGNLFVMSDRTQQVLRYDGTSGAFRRRPWWRGRPRPGCRRRRAP
jgi:hypothetical protein